MGTLAQWMGRSLEISSATTITLGSRVRAHRVTMTAGGQAVKMPDARKFQSVGGAVLIVWNTGANSYALQDNAGTVIEAALAQNEVAYLYLISQATAAGSWRAQIEATDTVPDPPVNDFFYTLGGNPTGMQKTAFKYEHVGNSWSTETVGSNHHIQACGAELAGKCVVFGSTGGGGQTGDEVDEYDPEVWTAKTACLLAAANSERCGDDDAGLAEVYGQNANPGVRHDQYDISLDSWATRNDFPVKSRHAVARGPQNGKIYIYGGVEVFNAANNGTQSNREHTVGTDAFVSMTGLPTTQRQNHAGFVLGGNPFAVCGTEDNTGPTMDRNDEYVVSGDSWTVRAVYSRGANQGIGAAARVSGTAYAVGGISAKTGASYQVDTWSNIADHPSAASNADGIPNSSFALTT